MTLPVVLIALVLGSPASGAVRQKADRLVQEATVDYNASDFEGALAKLTEAYKLKSDAALLFDIAQCHRALHHWERAEFTYKAYLKEKPEAHDRKKVRALIAKVQAERDREQAAAAQAAKQKAADDAAARAREEEAARQKEAEAAKSQAEAAAPAAPLQAAPAPAAATSAPTVTAEAEPHRRVPVISWVLGGVGAVVLIGGGYFAFADTQITGQNHPTNGSDGTPLNTITYAQFQQSQSDATLADTFFIAGGVLLVTAVVWAFVAPSRSGSKSAPPSTPNGVPF